MRERKIQCFRMWPGPARGQWGQGWGEGGAFGSEGAGVGERESGRWCMRAVEELGEVRAACTLEHAEPSAEHADRSALGV